MSWVIKQFIRLFEKGKRYIFLRKVVILIFLRKIEQFSSEEQIYAN